MAAKRRASSKRPTASSDPSEPPSPERQLEDSPQPPSVAEVDGKATKSHAEKPTPPSEQEPSNRYPIVGVGASAGGLEALQELFSHMPLDSGMGFVVVTHQHPGHISMLPALLGKSTRLPVVEARNGLKVEANHVYVGPPGSLLAIRGGTLRFAVMDPSQIPHLTIDYFFRSLAADQQERAICIILSGTGADGTLGLRAIKAELGMAMVQEPPSAKYAGMPSSATATGLADYILPTTAMPQQLVAYARGPYLRPRTAAEAEVPRAPLERIITLLRTRTGHDFAAYKETTIRRRIERRMNVHQVADEQSYIRYLQENPHEVDMLFNELLINVTSFFRDPQAFETLAEKALPDLIKSRADSSALRVWVPGCATGEEAYSLAIVIRECLVKLGQTCEVQVFGTDLDTRAIEVARTGTYPVGIAADVPAQRLERCFSFEENRYRVRKEIRELLVFAPHNVIKDPPFTKLDLIACRNLLIYLDSEAQRRLLPVFHYALRPGGLLFLGPSETVGNLPDLFETVDSKWKIYRRKESLASLQAMAEMPLAKQFTPPDDSVIAGLAGAGQSRTTSVIERLLLSRFAPTALVVNDRGSIIYVHGRTGPYLELTQGQPRNNVVEMASPGLAHPLVAALRQAEVEKREVVRPNLRVKSNGNFVNVTLSVMPLTEPEAVRGLLLITLVPAPEADSTTAARPSAKKAQTGRVAELEQELRYAKETLQATVDELGTSNEELKSTNEELQSTNEELQSANEELATSKEEMQSLNEELSTVNVELQAKVDELSRATDDMQNLLNNTDVATIFLDTEFRVKRYTEPAKRLVNLLPSDVGRPLSDLSLKIDYANLIEDCREVLQTLNRKEHEVHSLESTWHLVRILPYRSAENMIDGVVITFLNIDRPKREAEAVREFFESIVQTVRDPLTVLDAEFRVEFANEAFCRGFGVSRKAIEHRSIFELPGRQWDVAELRKRLQSIGSENTTFNDFVLEGDFPEAGHKRFRLNARRLERGPNEANMILIVLEELMDRKT